MKTSLRLKNFPISFFAPVLELAGFSLALLRAEDIFHLPHWTTLVALVLTIISLISVLSGYLLKFFSAFFKNTIGFERCFSFLEYGHLLLPFLVGLHISHVCVFSGYRPYVSC